MPDALTVITRAISEHRSIMEHVKLTGDTVNDIEALFTLYGAQSAWSQASITALIDKQEKLIQAISFLEQGLKNHFGFEEEALPPLFGELLMRAILHEHHAISRQISNAKTTLSNTKVEGLEHEELLSRKSRIQETINHLRQTIEEHAYHEEIILNMMKKVLEENKT